MTTESQPLIDCRNVRKIFPDSAGVPFAAVDDVSFRLSAGEIVGLLGPDGAGKTTLIRLITGLMKPHGGSISVLNLDSVKKSRSIQASIGYMPQKFGLYEDLTVRENMELYARMHGVYGQDREKRFRSLLAMTSLERFTTRLAGKLSGGMKQKLGLCCSLVSSPPLILLDEPTVGVDPLSLLHLRQFLRYLHHGRDRQRLHCLPFGGGLRRLCYLIPPGVSCASHPRKRVTTGGRRLGPFWREAPDAIFEKRPKLLSLSCHKTAYKSRQKPYNNHMQMIGGLKNVVQQTGLHAAAVR